MRASLEALYQTEGQTESDHVITLSPRQTECLFWVQQGKSSRDIATIMGVSHRIVERHVLRACGKLGVRTRVQAVVRARALGLILDPPTRGPVEDVGFAAVRPVETKSWRAIDETDPASTSPVEGSAVRSYELTDRQWIAIAHLMLCKDGDPGPNGLDNRAFVNAVLWVLRTGANWSDLPALYGNGRVVRSRFRRWDRSRVWKRVFAELILDPDNEHRMIDTILGRVYGRSARSRDATA